jgi:hypothetical protein
VSFHPVPELPLQNGFQIITEYQRRAFQIAPDTTHRRNDTFQLRLIYIQKSFEHGQMIYIHSSFAR